MHRINRLVCDEERGGEPTLKINSTLGLGELMSGDAGTRISSIIAVCSVSGALQGSGLHLDCS